MDCVLMLDIVRQQVAGIRLEQPLIQRLRGWAAWARVNASALLIPMPTHASAPGSGSEPAACALSPHRDYLS